MEQAKRWEQLKNYESFELDRAEQAEAALLQVIERLGHHENSDYSFDGETPEFFAYRCPNNREVTPGMTDYVTHWNVGDVWLTRRYPNGTNLSSGSTLFVLSYVLGMLVRYFPTKWTALVRGQIGDSALPTISAAIDLIENEYPRIVLGFMSNTHR